MANAVVTKCSAAQAYVARATARCWVAHQGAEASEKHLRKQERWLNLLVLQSEDPLGSTTLLTNLVRSASISVFSSRDVSTRFLVLVKQLIKSVGPQSRLLSLFSALCAAGGHPTRAYQEACVRHLWMKPADRYAFGITFHECHTPEAIEQVALFGQKPRYRHHVPPNQQPGAREDSKPRFVGDVAFNGYSPVVACWRAPGTRDRPTDWKGDGGSLWWAPEELNLPVVGARNPSQENSSPAQPPWPDQDALPSSVVGTKKTKKISKSSDHLDLGLLPLVPVELFLWPLEPDRLCLLVTGEDFQSYMTNPHAPTAHTSIDGPRGRLNYMPQREAQGEAAKALHAIKAKRFQRHKQLVESLRLSPTVSFIYLDLMFVPARFGVPGGVRGGADRVAR